MKPIVRCEHVDFGYEHHDVVTDLNLEIYEGDYLCVVGANGSGKSTLVKGLLGLLKPTGGALIRSEELTRGGIGYLPQQTKAQKDFPATVYEVVLSGALNHRGGKLFYSRTEKQQALVHMERLGILELKNRCYRELSGGQQQRALIARALCATKQMLILDEPIAGLDPTATREFYQLIKALNKDEHITIVMVTHDIDNAMIQADKILHLQQHTLYFGSTADYLHSRDGSLFKGGKKT